jgi:hypothetical protein
MRKNRVLSIIVALVLLICCTGVQGTATNLLRLEGSSGWTQQMTVNQGTTAYLVVLAEKEGIGSLNELSPDGCVHKYNYFFRVYDRLPYYANEPGRHVLSYTIDGRESNPVVIDVVGTCKPTAYSGPYAASPKGAYQHSDPVSKYAVPISQGRGGY